MAEKTFSIDLEESLHKRVKQLSIERGVPVKQVYAEALESLLDHKPPQHKNWQQTALDAVLASNNRDLKNIVDGALRTAASLLGMETAKTAAPTKTKRIAI